MIFEPAKFLDYSVDGCERCSPSNKWLFCDSTQMHCVSKVVINGNCSSFEGVFNVCHESVCINGTCSNTSASAPAPTNNSSDIITTDDNSSAMTNAQNETIAYENDNSTDVLSELISGKTEEFEFVSFAPIANISDQVDTVPSLPTHNALPESNTNVQQLHATRSANHSSADTATPEDNLNSPIIFKQIHPNHLLNRSTETNFKKNAVTVSSSVVHSSSSTTTPIPSPPTTVQIPTALSSPTTTLSLETMPSSSTTPPASLIPDLEVVQLKGNETVTAAITSATTLSQPFTETFESTNSNITHTSTPQPTTTANVVLVDDNEQIFANNQSLFTFEKNITCDDDDNQYVPAAHDL
ncbi:unnamed protein product, partial [Anisakis simplex]|uniref:Chitin-binding type-2 domain-containing protein n=1 Tax=Anisakis simplex TaxID=6269 RepID=A0A0M3KJC6_ANISI